MDLVVHFIRHANGLREVTEILSLCRVGRGIVESSLISTVPAAAEGDFHA